MKELKDEELMRLLSRNKTAVVGVLIERYQRPILSFMFRMVGNWELARDLTQDTFVKIWKSRVAFDTEKKFSVWLFTIARILVRDRFTSIDRTIRNIIQAY